MGAGACAARYETVVAAGDDACNRYGFTVGTAEYVRCQEQVHLSRRSNRAVTSETEARVAVEADAFCNAYGVSRGTVQFDRCLRDEFAARRPG